MPITRTTPYRDVGPVPYETWKREITNAGGRAELASRGAWEAAGPMSGVLLRILDQESSFDTNYRANAKFNNNPYNIRVKDRSNEDNPKGYVAYDNLIDATRAARRRIEGGSGFFDGANPYADDVTIRDLLYTYAPPPWNDTEDLIDEMVADLERWLPNWTPPVAPAEPQFATWRQQIDLMFGPGRNVTQDWAVHSGAANYEYGAGHGLDGHQHTGLDVGMPYGTRMYAPAVATVVCGGTGVGNGANGQGCDAFNDWGDGDGSGSKKGVGRIELLFPDGRSLIYGHSRTSAVKPGDKVTRGQFIGTSGGMNGAHIHLEAREFRNGDYWLIDPKDLLETLPITPDVPVEPGEQVALTIREQMIPRGNGNRPGTKLNDAPLWITIHETANPSRGAGAQMHADFVKNGGGSEGVSFHGTVDDKEAIQLLPADEVGYHAGDGCNSRADDIGCFQSFAIETCVNSDSNWSTAKKNLVDFVAAIITGDPRIDFAGRKGDFSVDRIAQHNKWSGKNCPAKIRAEGSWNSLLAQIKARVAELEGGVVTPPPPPEPEIIPGVDWGIAKRAFDNPALPGYVLTKGGPLSMAYIERVKQTGQLPKLVDRWPYADGRVYYPFSNGDIALFTESDKKIRWIGTAT